MRVLSVQHYPTFGGPHNEIVRLESHLRARGIETVVAITDDPGGAVPRLVGHVRVRTFSLGRARLHRDPRLNLQTLAGLPGDLRRLRGVIRREQVDLVKVHGPHNPQGAFAASLEGTPVVWVISSTRTPKATRRIGMRLVDRFADAVLVNGRGLLSAYPGSERVKGRAFPYYPPVQTDLFHPPSKAEREAVRADLQVPAGAPVVGTIANINPQKGIEAFVDMAAAVSREVRDTRFLVVGATSETQRGYYEKVERRAADLGLLPDRLSFLGERPDVARLLQAFDVKAITSVPESEGTTTTAIEAMACGVPVVATRVGAVPEVVDSGETGYLVPPLDPGKLAERVVALLRDDALRRKMATVARTTAVDRFGVERCADTHASAYEFALSR